MQHGVTARQKANATGHIERGQHGSSVLAPEAKLLRIWSGMTLSVGQQEEHGRSCEIMRCCWTSDSSRGRYPKTEWRRQRWYVLEILRKARDVGKRIHVSFCRAASPDTGPTSSLEALATLYWIVGLLTPIVVAMK